VPLRWDYLKRVAAGAIFGLYMAHLLYFLNPQVDITPLRLLTVTLLYGVICGLLFGSILWLLRLARVRLFGDPSAQASYRGHGFGFVVLAAFISASIYWIHLDRLRIYLPIGAVRILSKSTTVITVTAFLLLALWIMERNADRRTSRLLFTIGVMLIVVSSFFLYQRRESYRTEKREVVVANIGTVAGKRPVTVVAIRNLPYDWIVTMSGEGLLPFFEQATKSAYFTRLEPFPTTSPKALWASLATGKLPNRHGVTGRFSYRTALNGSDPDERFLLLPFGVGFQAWGLIPPVQRISAQLPAGDALPLWSLFERLQLHAEVVNWPSSPATGASRVITDRLLRASARADQPDVVAVSQRFNVTRNAKPIILKGLADDTAAVSVIRESKPYDLRVIALEGFSDAQRALNIFTNELPPRSSVKGEALRAYAQQLDRMLAAIVRENPDETVVLVSPSGVVPPALPASVYTMLSQAVRNEDAGADDGFLVITGPGAVHRPNPEPVSVADLVPTVLFAAGLPVGRDMDGRIRTDAFSDEFLRHSTLSAIQTYEAEQLLVRRNGA
jgi:hypothetical protein